MEIHISKDFSKEAIQKALQEFFPSLEFFHSDTYDYPLTPASDPGFDKNNKQHILFETYLINVPADFPFSITIYHTPPEQEEERSLYIARKFSNFFSVKTMTGFKHPSTFHNPAYARPFHNIIFENNKTWLADNLSIILEEFEIPDFHFDSFARFIQPSFAESPAPAINEFLSFFNSKNYAKAATYALNFKKEHGDNFIGYYMQSMIEMAHENNYDALISAKQAWQLAPNELITNFLLAKVYIALKDPVAARKFARFCFTSDRSNAEYNFLLSEIAAMQNNTEEAEHYILSAIFSDPHNNLYQTRFIDMIETGEEKDEKINMLDWRGREDEIREKIMKLLSEAPDQSELFYSLYQISLVQGKKQLSEFFLSHSREINPNEPKAAFSELVTGYVEKYANGDSGFSYEMDAYSREAARHLPGEGLTKLPELLLEQILINHQKFIETLPKDLLVKWDRCVWNDRKEYQIPLSKLTGQDLYARLNYYLIEGIGLSDKDLRVSNLSFSNIEKVTFLNLDLSISIAVCSKIRHSHFYGVNFQHTDCSQAGFSNSDFENCNFDNSDLQNLTCSDCRFKNCSFKGSQWKKANCEQCLFESCNFNATTKHPGFYKCEFVDCGFDSATAAKIEFKDCIFRNKYIEDPLKKPTQMPRDEDYYNRAISLEDKLGDYEGAKILYEKALIVDPDNAQTHYRYGRLIHKNSGDYKLAMAHYEKAISLNPAHGYAHNNLAALLQLHFKDFEAAKRHFELAIASNEDPILHRNYAALLHDYLHDYIKAQRHYEKALALDPQNKNVHVRYADLLQEHLGDYFGAKEHYIAALLIDPQDAGTHTNFAILLEMHFGDFDAAKEHYEAAVDINPGSEEAHYNYAIFLNNCGDYEGAKKHYECAIAIKPLHEGAQHNFAILLYEHFSNYDEARLHFEQTLAINPKNGDAHRNYAWLLFQHFPGDFAIAEDHFRQAISIKPKSEKTYCCYAALLKDRHRYEEARANYEHALFINPQYEQAHVGYANLLSRHFKEYEIARQHYEKALVINPENTNARYGYDKVLKEELKINDAMNELQFSQLKTFDEFLKGDFGTFFYVKELERETRKDTTVVHCKTGGFKEFVDLFISTNEADQVTRAKLSVTRSWLDQPAIGRFGIDIIKSFIKYFADDDFIKPLADAIWLWEREGEETIRFIEKEEAYLQDRELMNAFNVIADKLEYYDLVTDNFVYGFANEHDFADYSWKLIITIAWRQ